MLNNLFNQYYFNTLVFPVFSSKHDVEINISLHFSPSPSMYAYILKKHTQVYKYRHNSKPPVVGLQGQKEDAFLI